MPCNLAARLKPVCPRGKIVIDRATRDRLGRAFHFAALGPQLLEGIKGKVEAFVLDVPRSGLTKFAAHNAARSRPLVGRDARTGGTEQAVAACVRGSGPGWFYRWQCRHWQIAIGTGSQSARSGAAKALS